MRRSILSIAVALAAMTAVPAHAQQVVYDPTSFAQMVKDARTAIEQLDSLKAQVQQGEELFASLNDLSNVNAIAERLGLPEIRNPLPDMATLRSAADGDLSALGELAERADTIRRALTGPIPGTRSSVSRSARMTSTGNCSGCPSAQLHFGSKCGSKFGCASSNNSEA